MSINWDVVSTIFSAGGILVAIAIFLITNRRLQRIVKEVLEKDIRKTIDRIERNKEPFKTSNKAAYDVLFDLQHELEVISSKIKTVFKLKQKT